MSDTTTCDKGGRMADAQQTADGLGGPLLVAVESSTTRLRAGNRDVSLVEEDLQG